MRRSSWSWTAAAVVGLLIVAAVAFALGRSTGAPSESRQPTIPTTTEADPGVSSVTTAGSPATPMPTTIPTAPADGFLETFDGNPDAPTPWNPPDWDVTVHSRDVSTWDSLEPMEAHHTSMCGSPESTATGVHETSSYDGAVFLCKDHVMTSLLAGGYGLIYLTPAQVLDFGEGTATIQFDLSTWRSSARDWWSVWITPFEENLQLPLESWLPDLSGPPRDAVQVRLDTANDVRAEIFDDFENVQFPDYPNDQVPGDWSTTYDTFLKEDAARRDTFEIQISRTHLKVGMPAYDFWWIDTDIPELAFSSGVVQFGHHSYNPEKDCGGATQPGPDGRCEPNTWHWDNIRLSPSTPFQMAKPDQRFATADQNTLTFATPALEGSHLRFAGAGGDRIEVSYDGGAWQAAVLQDVGQPFEVGTFESYWTPIPAGTTSVRFRGEDWYGGPWRVRDATIWTSPSQ